MKLDYDGYFHDPRFQKKKPYLHGSWQERRGDNIYFEGGDGKWGQLPSLYHTEPTFIAQDTRYAVVYMGTEFCYFGKLAYNAPTTGTSPKLTQEGQRNQVHAGFRPFFSGCDQLVDIKTNWSSWRSA